MKFVHIADMHFDIPFTTLGRNDLGDLRRLEQREIFKNIINYIKQNNIEYLFICGDLYEHEYVKQSTIEFINNQFKEIPNTKIFITPGNHDPRLINSYYNKFNWNNNVYIFNQKVEKIEDKNICIYGYGFNDFYLKDNQISQIGNIDDTKINILLTHATIDAGTIEDKEYNPISRKQLKDLKMDYIALGHIHKTTKLEDKEYPIIYSGSPIALGFDEPGKHGMIVGEILDNKTINLEFIKLDKKEFIEKEVAVDNIFSKEELIENINSIELEEDKYYKILLVGERNFEIDTYDIYKYIFDKKIIKVKDNTKNKLNLKEIASENSLKGIFVKNMLEKIEQESENKEKLLRAIEIGLDAM